MGPASPDPIPIVLPPGFEYRMLEWRHPETHEIHWRLERRKSALREKASDRLPAGNIRNVRAHARTEWGAVRNPQCRSALLMLMCPNVGVTASRLPAPSRPTAAHSIGSSGRLATGSLRLQKDVVARGAIRPWPPGRVASSAPLRGDRLDAFRSWSSSRPNRSLWSTPVEQSFRGEDGLVSLSCRRAGRSSLREAQPSARAGVSRAQPRQTIDWVCGEGTTAVWRPPRTTAQVPKTRTQIR